MASAAVDSASDHRHLVHLHLESLPLIDLRHLSQSELYSLSLCSPSSLSSHRRLDDDLVIPKIDRSVFNESAGSRKQTYSRLRLAPRKPQSLLSSSAASTPIPSRNPLPLDKENAQIVALLKRLFAADSPAQDQDLIPVHIEFREPTPLSSDAACLNVPIGAVESCNAVFQSVPVGIVGGGVEDIPESSNSGALVVPVDQRKRKRGRPRKNENRVVESESKSREVVCFRAEVADTRNKVETKEMAVVNVNGVAVDVGALGNLEDPFGEELRRRTEGFQTLEQFLEYLDGVNGEWGSKRKKRKVVNASDFGDILPTGWKLVLCLKKKAGRVWLICSRYISPYGQQFVSCKEVSSYLLSGFGFQGVAQTNSANGTNETVHLAHKVNSGDAAEHTPKGDKKNGDDLAFCSPLSVTSTDHGRQDILPLATGDPGGVQRGGVLKCHKCTMSYTEKDDLLHHLLTFHKGSAKSCKSTTYINDEVLLKDGKYECQFCHKLFDEKHRYNGHLGVHIKSYVKRVEASAGVGTMQKMVHPGSVGVPPQILKVQEPTCCAAEDSVAETSNASYSPQIEIKEDATNETYAGTYSLQHNLLSQDELAKKDNNTDNTRVGSFGEQDIVCEVTDCTVGKVDGSSDVIVAESNVCFGALIDNKTRDIHESSGDADALKCTNVEIDNCAILEGSENNSISLSIYEKIAAKNVDRSCISSIEEHDQAKCYVSGVVSPSSKENICGNDNIGNMPFTSTAEHMDIDGEDKLGNDKLISGSSNNYTGPEHTLTNSKQQSSSEGRSPFPFGNDGRFSFFNDAYGKSTSILAESVQEKGSLSGSLTSSVEKQTFVLNNNAYRASASILEEPKFSQGGNSWNKELKIGMVADQTTSNDDDAITSNKVGRSFGRCSVPLGDEMTCKARNVNPNSSIQEPWHEKGVATCLYTPHVNDRTAGFHDNVYKVSGGMMDNKLKFVDVRNNCESIAYGSNDTKVDANLLAGIEERENSRASFFAPSSIEQAFTFNSYGICSSTLERPKQVRGYEGGLRCPSGSEQSSVDENNVKKVSSSFLQDRKYENVRSCWNSGQHVALDGSHARTNRNALSSTLLDGSSRDCNLGLSGNVQSYALGNNASGIVNSTIEESKQKRGPESSFLRLSGGVQNNLNAMYAGMAQEPNRSQNMESMRLGFGNHAQPNMESMRLGFGNHAQPNMESMRLGFGNHAQPNVDVMSEFMWRTNGENALHNGLADTSSPMGQSYGSFPTFGMMSDKGGNELFNNVNEKFDSMSGFRGLRSDSMGHLEYSFMSGQTGSNSGNSKVLSYEADAGQGFDSSVWFQKEALPLLPKIADRHQATSFCVWCRNEFNYEGVESGTQTSSMGSMCSSCKAKFSGQLSLF